MMPLYDILNEFQKGHSHMAVVVRHFDKTGQQSSNNNCTGKYAHACYVARMLLRLVVFRCRTSVVSDTDS